MRNICLSVIALLLFACGGDGTENADDRVIVYMDDSAVQCEFDGFPPQETAQTLIDAGIDVLESSCGYINGVDVPALCGIGDTSINVHTIRQENLSDAQALGYTPVDELIDGYTETCS